MLKKSLKYLPAVAIIAYLLFSAVVIPQTGDNDRCKEIVVSISGNNLGTISNGEILDTLRAKGEYPLGRRMDMISCMEIENSTKRIPMVKSCQAYKTNNNRIILQVECREPLLKVFANDGSSFIIDIDGNIVDNIDKPLFLPIVSGRVDKSMINNELGTIVESIKHDPFWLAQIEQIYFNENKEAIITPRVGNHTIEVGTIRELDEKLASIKTFYLKGLNIVGWDKYSKLNVKISNKVICTKRDE